MDFLFINLNLQGMILTGFALGFLASALGGFMRGTKSTLMDLPEDPNV